MVVQVVALTLQQVAQQVDHLATSHMQRALPVQLALQVKEMLVVVVVTLPLLGHQVVAVARELLPVMVQQLPVAMVVPEQRGLQHLIPLLQPHLH